MKTNKNLIGTLQDGRNYEVKIVEFMDTIDSNGGAKPWMIGKKIKNTRKALFIDGESIATISARTHRDVQEVVNSFNL